MFVRIAEVVEGAKQKIQSKVKVSEVTLREGWEKTYDEAKISLSDCYQSLIYFQKYDILQLLSVAKRKQNNRIFIIVPPKNRKVPIILNPIPKP